MEKEVLLQMRDISKSFPGVKALDSVSLTLYRGEIHALLGENGAGKSTLMKILSGVYQKDSGEITIEGKSVNIENPRQAQELGISIIHQELNLVNHLTVMENIFLGREPKGSFGFINRTVMKEKSQAVLDMLGSDINPEQLVAELSIGEQQMVEIAKALSINTKILIMDEPTAALTERETERLFIIIKKLAAKGVGIVYISHRMEELFTISDSVTVMRDGKYIKTLPMQSTCFDELVKLMVGRDITTRFPKQTITIGKEVFRAENISRSPVLHNINLHVCEGEIVGIAGLMGAGRTELARAIFGADKIDNGSIYVDNSKKQINCPEDAIKAGIALITEDRKAEGLVLGMSVNDNISLASLKGMSRSGFVSQQAENELVQKYIKELNIRTPHAAQLVKNLSGGNQQKVVIAKWLLTNPRLLIMDEPTRGVDVGAKAEIYNIINMLAASGVGIIMISSELPEILGMSDRVIVMHSGRVTAEMPIAEATQEKIMAFAAKGE